MNNLAVINQVAIIFFMIIIGVYAKKKRIVDENINKGLTALLLNITLPLNIISSFNFNFSADMIKNMFIVFIFGLLIHPICYFLAKTLYKKSRVSEKNILIFATIFSNCGFMAFPILESIYGKTGVLYGSMFLAPFNLFLWTVGVRLFSQDSNLKGFKNVFNPGVIAVGLGLILFVFSIKLPYVFQRSFEVVGSMTTPLSMIITGVVIADLNIKDIFSSGWIYYVSVVRLLMIPLITFIIFGWMDIEGVTRGICVLISAMPAASMATVLAEQYGANSLLASKYVFVTTLLSLLTIPIFVILVK